MIFRGEEKERLNYSLLCAAGRNEHLPFQMLWENFPHEKFGTKFLMKTLLCERWKKILLQYQYF